MNGKKLALIISFTCWMSIIIINWLQIFGIVEYGMNTALHIGMFVIFGIGSGAMASERNERK